MYHQGMRSRKEVSRPARCTCSEQGDVKYREVVLIDLQHIYTKPPSFSPGKLLKTKHRCSNNTSLCGIVFEKVFKKFSD